MATELGVAFDNLISAFYELKESVLEEQQTTNSRLNCIEAETIKTRDTVKSAARMVLGNLE